MGRSCHSPSSSIAMKPAPSNADLATSSCNDPSVRFPYLDGLRGFAVLIVVLGHYSIFFPGLGPIVGPSAKTGVWLFFLLSSFLLTRQMILVFRDAPTTENVLRYFARRALRILPLYYFVLTLLFFLPTFAQHMFGHSGFAVSDHLFLLYPQGIFWAISVECEYYAFIPIVALLVNLVVRIHRSLGALLAAGLAILAAQNYHWAWIEKGFPVNYPHLPNYTHFFLVGSAIAIIFQYRSALRGRFDTCWNFLFAAGVAWQLFVIPYPFRDVMLDSIGFPIAWWHWMAQHPGQLISCSAIVLSILFSEYLQRVSSSSTLRFFGKISFSLYCLHILPTAYFGPWVAAAGPLVGVAGFFCISVAISVITYRCIELPCMELVRGPSGAHTSRGRAAPSPLPGGYSAIENVSPATGA